MCVSGEWVRDRESEGETEGNGEREIVCVGGIRFDKVPYFSEIITRS